MDIGINVYGLYDLWECYIVNNQPVFTLTGEELVRLAAPLRAEICFDA